MRGKYLILTKTNKYNIKKKENYVENRKNNE